VQHTRVPPPARHDRSEVSTHCDATAPPPSHGRRRACQGWHMRVPPLARRDRSGTSHTVPLVRATRQPSPATAGGWPAPGGTCVCRRRRAAIAARLARTVPLARRDCPPQPRPAEGPRRAAHAGAATGASRSQRDEHAPCRSLARRDRPPQPRPQRARAWRHMCVPPSACRDRSETTTHRAARATRSPSPATAGRGPARGGACVCRHGRVAIAARRARTVPLARRLRPPQPPLVSRQGSGISPTPRI
jgi:hypothetical protein